MPAGPGTAQATTSPGHDQRRDPGAHRGRPAGLSGTGGYFRAQADTARTLGCLRSDGTFDRSTSFVVRTEQTPLSGVYCEPDSNWLLGQFARCPDRDVGPPFFLNYRAVQVNWADDMTPTQYGLKVTNVNISIDDAHVFGTTTWSAPAPCYAWAR